MFVYHYTSPDKFLTFASDWWLDFRESGKVRILAPPAAIDLILFVIIGVPPPIWEQMIRYLQPTRLLHNILIYSGFKFTGTTKRHYVWLKGRKNMQINVGLTDR